jgi:hypothetical protein
MSQDPYWEKTKYNPNMRRDAIHVVQQTGNGPAKFMWGGLLAIFAVIGTAIWPYFIWHGEGGATGYQRVWDTSSWIACGIWWGIIAVTAIGFAVRAIVILRRRPL